MYISLIMPKMAWGIVTQYIINDRDVKIKIHKNPPKTLFEIT